MSALCIDRCVCFQVPFAALRPVAEATGAQTVAELQQHVRFGQKCRMCHPYARRMLRTGEVVFGEILTDAHEPAPGAEAARRAGRG